jgi:hypothetical protein
MIKLINGRGQLGMALQNYIKTLGDPTPDDTEYLIYHTWNIEDQSLEAQIKEYEKFSKFVYDIRDSNCLCVFISTLHENDGHYLYYKMKAESLLKEERNNYKIYRIPYMIGKGLCHKIIYDKYDPLPGKIEVSTLQKIAYRIIGHLQGPEKLICLHGDWLDVNSLKEALLYERA